jgi:hypothetical protein
MAQRYHRGNHKPLEEEQTIQWLKDTTEVIRSREEEQIIQWFKDTKEEINIVLSVLPLTASDYLCGIF